MDLRSLIKKHEGSRLRPYVDTTGNLTIGVGRNLDAKGISEDEQELMLTNDISDTIAGLTRNCEWFHGLDPVRRDAIVDMAFNLGIRGEMEFKQMIGAIEDAELHHSFPAIEMADWEAAGAAILNSRWARQVGARAREIAAMIVTGEYQA